MEYLYITQGPSRVHIGQMITSNFLSYFYTNIYATMSNECDIHVICIIDGLYEMRKQTGQCLFESIKLVALWIFVSWWQALTY